MGTIRNFVDSIFNPISQFLDKMYDGIITVGRVSAKGIRLDDYFGFFAILGPEWTRVITSLIASIMFLFVLFMIQKYSRVLLWFKSLVKWW